MGSNSNDGDDNDGTSCSQKPPLKRRRRRKRRLMTKNDPCAVPSFTDFSDFLPRQRPSSTKESSSNKDQQSFCVIPVETTSISITELLAQREAGQWRNRRSHIWESRVLIEGIASKNEKDFRSNGNNIFQRRKWRDFAKRKIPFTALETPVSDAVLALDSTGMYVLSLGSDAQSPRSSSSSATHPHNSEKSPLSLRFYGVPSPSTLQKKKRNRTIIGPLPTVISPLILNLPLCRRLSFQQRFDHYPFNEMDGFEESLAASTPVSLWLSSDWRIGVAILRLWRNESWSGGSLTGTAVIFPLPRTIVQSGYSNSQQQRPVVNVLKCHNITLPSVDSLARGRNLFWQVDALPSCICHDDSANDNSNGTDKYFTCTTVLNLPGYLYALDEEDGFLLTWIIESSWNSSRCHSPVLEETPTSPGTIRPQSNKIVRAVQGKSEWEHVATERLSGIESTSSSNSSTSDSGGQIKVAFEARFSVQELLVDILLRRPHLVPNFDNKSPSKLPTYFYDLIGITRGGRSLEILICVLGSKESMGVFVVIDLFTQSYQELQWVKCATAKANGHQFHLRKWCSRLALNWRMRQKRMGPHSVTRIKTVQNWGSLCSEPCFDDLDEVDDSDPAVWERFLEHSNQSTTSIKSMRTNVSLASLYPDCEVVDNRAVLSRLPVMSMKCRSAPSELVYG